MEVKTDMKVVTPQQNIQAKEVQPQKKVEPQSTEPGPKQNAQPVADKITISAQGVESQKKNENIKGGVKQTQTSQSLVNTLI
jgi:hypothetical protein